MSFFRCATSAVVTGEGLLADIENAPWFKVSKLESHAHPEVFETLQRVFMTPLRFETNLALWLAFHPQLRRNRRGMRAALRAGGSANRRVDRGCPAPALPRCHHDCCEPIRRCPEYALRARRTSGSRRPARDRGRDSGGLGLSCWWKPFY